MASYSDIEKDELKKASDRSKNYSDKATGLSDSAKAEIQKSIDAANAQVQSQSQQATASTNSAYDNLINAADIDRMVMERSIEKAIGNQPLNSSQQVSMNLAQGNAQYNANARREAAARALSDILSSYNAKSKANQITSNAGFDNSISGSIAANQAAGTQNALSSAAKMYGNATESEIANANAQAKAQMQALSDNYAAQKAERDAQIQAMQDEYKAQKAAQDQYYSNLSKLMKGDNPRSYEDAVAILNGQEPPSEKMARMQAEQTARNEDNRENLTKSAIEQITPKLGMKPLQPDTVEWKRADESKLNTTLTAPEIAKAGSWIDPDKSVRQFAESVRSSVNSGNIDMDTAVKKIISLYGLKDNPNLQQFEYQGNTIYAPNDKFKNSQISFAIDMAGLRPYVDANKNRYYNANVNEGSWILQ